MRVGEAVLIKCEQVDTEHNIINMRNVKGKRFEQIPVIAPVAELFKRMDLKKEYLFQWRTYASVETFWKRLMERIVIVRDEKGNILPQKDKKGNLRPIQLETEVMIERPYSLHQFRKMCGTNLANSGVSPFFLRTYLRHKDIRTTLKYYTRADMNKLETEINDKVTWPVKKPVKK
jgi:integrase